MENETIAQRALRLLSPIPTEQFITGIFSNGFDSCCVVGHYTRLTSSNPNDYSIRNCMDLSESWQGGELRRASTDFFSSRGDYDNIASINNGKEDSDFSHPIYNQSTPKERSIALLTDMVAAGY